jgi:hypothetical protein
MKGYEIGKPFYQANVWIKNGAGDPLLLEEFTTKREAVKCIKDFVKKYKGKGKDELDCYVSHFDEDECSDYSFNV